jgi:hypothetical protein
MNNRPSSIASLGAYFFLILSFTPALFLSKSFGPMTGPGIMAVIIAIGTSVMFTVIGVIAAALIETKMLSRIFWIGTIISALPGLYLWAAISLAHG